MDTTNYRQKDFVWGALVGGAVATLTALLFTTKKGKQIREQIGDLYHEIEGNVKSALSESKDKIEEGVETLSKKAASVGKEK
jgi:gas vesicle protein